MVKSAENPPRDDLAVLLHGPMARTILGQRQMRSEFVEVGGVARKDPAQVGLAEDDDVIQAFMANRADHSLRMSVVPG